MRTWREIRNLALHRSQINFGWLELEQKIWDREAEAWNLCSDSTDIVCGENVLYKYYNGF